MNKLLLKDKVAIVTGASRGIGYAISELFVQEGCTVLMIARRPDVLENTAGKINAAGYPGKAVPMVGDVAKEDTSIQAFKLALENFGKVDIVINNAGLGETCSIDSTPTEHWKKYIELDLFGPFYFCREASKYFAKTKEGVILNVSSINGVKPGNGVTYCTAKGALNTMTRNIAIRFAGTRVRVNTLSPGMTDTDVGFKTTPDFDGAINMRQFSTPYINDKIDGHIPPLQQAYAALFLCCEMSECITGQNLIVEKGRYFN